VAVGEAVGIALCIFVNSRGSRQFRNVPSAANCRLVGERLKSTLSGPVVLMGLSLHRRRPEFSPR
jgi:hypothetical protein